MSDFAFSVSKASGYFAPNGKEYAERWWDEVSEPKTLVQLAAGSLLLAQLNALILRETISADTAEQVRTRLTTDPGYDHYWHQLGVTDLLAWNSRPESLAFVLSNEFGKRIGNTEGLVKERLRAGYVVVLEGRSEVAEHSRVAFEPAGMPDEVFVHDAKYPETTGVYSYADLAALHTKTRVLAY